MSREIRLKIQPPPYAKMQLSKTLALGALIFQLLLQNFPSSLMLTADPPYPLSLPISKQTSSCVIDQVRNVRRYKESAHLRPRLKGEAIRERKGRMAESNMGTHFLASSLIYPFFFHIFFSGEVIYRYYFFF